LASSLVFQKVRDRTPVEGRHWLQAHGAVTRKSEDKDHFAARIKDNCLWILSCQRHGGDQVIPRVVHHFHLVCIVRSLIFRTSENENAGWFYVYWLGAVGSLEWIKKEIANGKYAYHDGEGNQQ
jgi:hypothetical protein